MRRERLKLASECPPPDEDEYTDRLANLLKQSIADSYPRGSTLRPLHPKEHGLVSAKFIVEHDLPGEQRIGVFKEARSYPALIRFSNASPTVHPDYTGDARGISIKLLGVEGETLLDGERGGQRRLQSVDFIAISYDSFFAEDPKEVYFLTKAFFAGGLAKLWYFVNPFNSHIESYLQIRRSSKRHTSPLDIRYWSMTPYLFGTRAVKYSVRPWSHTRAAIPKNPTPNYLRENMQRQLSQDTFYFDFMVQFQTDPYTMPVENPMVSWDEKVSPFLKLATIVIPAQRFDTAARMEFGDNLSYNPWRCLPEHRPLGGINRSRKRIYEATSKFRHERNEICQIEPGSNVTLALERRRHLED